jgi:hypothetical protein
MSGFFRSIMPAAATGCLILALATTGQAGVNLPWSTSYDCSDWSQGGQLSCDSLVKYGDWTCGSGQKEQITAQANNPLGAGGKGQRQWAGDGTNDNSGSTVITFNAPQRELWIRWYMRYEAGFKWSALQYDKLIYLDNTTVPEFYGWDSVNVYTAPSGNHASATGGWDTVMKNGAIDPATGHRTSDGQWHWYEVHLKNDGTNGIAEFWVDGVRYLSAANVNFGTDFTHVIIGENQNSPNNGGCSFIDFDDLAISSTGSLGPVAGAKRPAAPKNLR